jgi:hypothetical protein
VAARSGSKLGALGHLNLHILSHRFIWLTSHCGGGLRLKHPKIPKILCDSVKQHHPEQQPITQWWVLETIVPIPGRFMALGFPHLKKHPETSYRLKHKCSNEGYCTMCIASFCIRHYNDLQNSLFSYDCLERLQKTSKVSANMIRHSPCLTISFYSILKPKSLDGDHQMDTQMIGSEHLHPRGTFWRRPFPQHGETHRCFHVDLCVYIESVDVNLWQV